MAISIQTNPQSLMPAYNQIIFAATSTNQTQESFSFVFDIYSAGTASRLARVKLPQNPAGIGVVDVHRILENYLSYDLQPTATGITNSLNSRAKYDVYIGEEYKFYWPFTVGFSSSGAQALSSSTVHTYSTGDRLNVETTNASLNGVYSVTVLNNKSIALNTNYITATSGATFTGTAIYSDYRKTVFSGLSSVTDLAVVNAALSFDDFRSWSAGTYYLGVSNFSKFLTDVPDEFEVRTGSTIWLNFYTQAPALYTGTNTQIQVLTYDAQNQLEGLFYISGTTAGTDKLRKAAVGCYNLNNSTASASFGSLPIIKPTTAKYYIGIVKAGSLVSELKSFIVNQDCSMYDEVQLVFLDRKGSFVGKSFELASKEEIDITREEFKKPAGSYLNYWSYNSYDRGRTNLTTNIKRKYTVNSNWITETDAAYLEQLFTSPEVYWNDNGTFKAVVITSNSYEVKKRITSKLINLIVEFELANNDEIQRG